MPKGIPKNGLNKGWFTSDPRPEKRSGITIACPCGEKVYCERNRIGRKKYCSKSCLSKYKVQPIRTEEWRQNIGAALRGKAYLGNGGHIYSRDSRNYKKWRESVLKRDNRCCVLCGNKDVQVHHILRWADFPHLRFNVYNGIVLCQKHHPRKKEEEIRHSKMFNYLTYKNA